MKNKSIDLSGLPKSKKGDIEWSKAAGFTIPFRFNEYEGKLTLLEYNGKKNQVLVQYDTFKTWLGPTKLYYCLLEKLFKIQTHKYFYQSGNIVNGLQIMEQTWKDNNRAYTYKCTVCGYEGVVLQTRLKNKECGCLNWKQHKKQQ